MGKVGGTRNFGYGKQMDWAGKNALADRYGEGHYATRAAHVERWRQFVAYAKSFGIKDARAVTHEDLAAYGRELATRVDSGQLAVAYAQNLLSSVNVVLETMRGDRQLRVSPVELIGERHQVRDSTPAGWERNKVNAAVVALRERDQARVAAVAELTRDLGLRFREASLLDVRSALSQAQELGQVNITQGTKGGRGHEMDRWVPMSERVLRTLTSAAAVQAEDRNLVPSCMNFSQWKNHVYPIWSSVSERHGLRGFHDLRAAYACERYQQLTGTPAPAIGGQRGVDKPTDHAARQILSRELGHGRVDVVAAYVGSAR